MRLFLACLASFALGGFLMYGALWELSKRGGWEGPDGATYAIVRVGTAAPRP